LRAPDAANAANTTNSLAVDVARQKGSVTAFEQKASSPQATRSRSTAQVPTACPAERFCRNDGHTIVEIGAEISEQFAGFPEQPHVIQHLGVREGAVLITYV
jgi:hypothetical protein